MTQVRAVAAALVAVAKERGIATVLVGHVTKDGQVAGPRVLEHLVDVVLQFEGDKFSSLRLVRGLKNRFGAADEVGCFEMHEGGLTSLPDPSGLFLTRYADAVPGTCVTVAMEGRRALVTEVQALVGAQVAGSPRRTVSGLDSARLGMVLAVLQRRSRAAPARPGGLRGHRRRHPGGRAGGRPRRGPRRRLGRPRAAARPGPRGHRRGRAHRRGPPGRAPCRGGSPRRPGSASGTRSCHRAVAPPRPAACRRG